MDVNLTPNFPSILLVLYLACLHVKFDREHAMLSGTEDNFFNPDK